MRNNYLCLLCLTIFSFSFSQAPIVTIDRANGAGPTITGNDTNMTSTGLVRGVGISQAGGGDFNSNSWNGTDLATAQTENDYLEWTATGDATFAVDITEIDIRVDRSNTGPTTWQIMYSLDGFATAGIDITGAQTANTTGTNFTFPGLTINSGTAGTITFRLYAWGASNTGAGTFDIEGNGAWTGFGITDPGARLTGTIDAIAAPADADSDITVTAFDPTDNIDYSSFSAASGLTTANAIKIGEFEIRDGGATAPDADAFSTILTDLQFAIVNSSNIAALAIFDGVTNVGESTTVSASTAFTGLTLTAADDATKTFDVYATFNSSVTDNAQLALTIDAATADAAGSTFAAADAGAAATPTVGDDNRIEVIGTALAFTTQPNITNTNSVMSPAPEVVAVDVNSNIDLDFIGLVNVVSTGSLDGASTTAVAALSGTATFSNLIHDTAGTGLILTASSTGLSDGLSTTFSIVDAVIDIIAVQRFDFASTPEWVYSSDVPFFNNIWGSPTGGFYGVRPAGPASSPLSNPNFADFILGENDLDDEGANGTSGFATFSLATIDISAVINATVSFDWEVIGYDQTNDQAIYELVYDGVGQGDVLLAGGGTSTGGSGSISVAVPDTVSQVALRIKLRNNGSNGFSGFDNFLLTGSYAGLIYNGVSWAPSAPDGTTGSEDAIVLSGTPDISTDVVLNNVSIRTGAGLNVLPTGNLTVNGNIDTGNNLVICSTSTQFPSLIVNGTATGRAVYKRYINEAFANELVSAPLAGQTFADFASENPNMFEDPTPGSDLVLFGPFNNITGSYETYSQFDTTVMPSGIGYRTGRDAAYTPFLDTFSFNGTIPHDDVNVTLSRQPTGTHFEWNSVGNPYPSYILARDFLLTNTADFDVARYGIYGYDGNAADGWDILNLANTTASTKLAPAQGFLVAAAVDGAVITFESDKRRTGTTDDFIPGDALEDPISYNVQFGLTSGSNSYKTEVYFNEASTLSLDPGYDAALFGSGAPEFSIYTKLVDNNSDNDFAIQSLPHTNVDNVIIPLGVHIEQGQQATIKINNHTLPQGVNLYLEDTVENTFTLLNSNDYVFTSSTTLSDTGRFFLHFESETLSNPENTLNALQIYNTVNPKALFVKGQLDNGAVLKLIDIQGRIVFSSNLNNNTNSHKFDISNITSGIYIVTIESNTSNKSQKIIIR